MKNIFPTEKYNSFFCFQDNYLGKLFILSKHCFLQGYFPQLNYLKQNGFNNLVELRTEFVYKRFLNTP